MKTKKIFKIIQNKYEDFNNISLLNLIALVLKYRNIKNYVIKLIGNWQSPYDFIHSLELVKKKILKLLLKLILSIVS